MDSDIKYFDILFSLIPEEITNNILLKGGRYDLEELLFRIYFHTDLKHDQKISLIKNGLYANSETIYSTRFVQALIFWKSQGEEGVLLDLFRDSIKAISIKELVYWQIESLLDLTEIEEINNLILDHLDFIIFDTRIEIEELVEKGIKIIPILKNYPSKTKMSLFEEIFKISYTDNLISDKKMGLLTEIFSTSERKQIYLNLIYRAFFDQNENFLERIRQISIFDVLMNECINFIDPDLAILLLTIDLDKSRTLFTNKYQDEYRDNLTNLIFIFNLLSKLDHEMIQKIGLEVLEEHYSPRDLLEVLKLNDRRDEALNHELFLAIQEKIQGESNLYLESFRYLKSDFDIKITEFDLDVIETIDLCRTIISLQTKNKNDKFTRLLTNLSSIIRI